MPTSLKLMVLFWQVLLIKIFGLTKFCINTGSQYGSIVVSSAAGNFSGIGPKVLFEPVLGLGTSYQFIRVKRRARTATIAIAAYFGDISCYQRPNNEYSLRE